MRGTFTNRGWSLVGLRPSRMVALEFSSFRPPPYDLDRLYNFERLDHYRNVAPEVHVTHASHEHDPDQSLGLGRAVGVAGLGAVYDFVLTDMDSAPIGLVEERLLSIGSGETTLPLSEPDYFSIRFIAGPYLKSEPWVELYDPFQHRRQKLTGETMWFGFLQKVEGAIVDAFKQEGYQVDSLYGSAWRVTAEQYVETAALTAQAMLLASFFADLRLEFSTLLHFLFTLPTYADTHAAFTAMRNDNHNSHTPVGSLPPEVLDAL